MRRWFVLFGFAALAFNAAAAEPAKPLSDYVGTYDDADGPVEIVAADTLFAVIDEAKYTLRASDGDSFTAMSGDRVSFTRDAQGRVSSYESHGITHRRLRATVSDAAAALGSPRNPGDATLYRYTAPPDRHDGIAVGSAAQSDLGVDTAERIVRGVLDGTWRDVHGILLAQHGRLVLEAYFYGYGPQRPHQLRSATKSVVSAVVGAAIDRGQLSGTTERVLPQSGYAAFANADPRKERITLGDLLTMQSGLDCDDHDGRSPGNEQRIDETPDWVKATLDLRMLAEPGQQGRYCSGGVAVAGRMAENAVQLSLPEFAWQTLFEPLGMARDAWRWNYTLDNSNREYAQIHLRPRDMLKLGLMYAAHGRWNGRQVLSADWVDRSLARQGEVENTEYGYFWWRPWLRVQTPQGEQRITFNAAQGNGGQKIYLFPQFDLVAVFTGGDYNSGGSPPNRIMAELVLPPLIAAQKQAAPLR